MTIFVGTDFDAERFAAGRGSFILHDFARPSPARSYRICRRMRLLSVPARPRALFRRAAVPVGAGLALGVSMCLRAQDTPLAQLDPVVVTATRSAERAFDLPLAIDTVERTRFNAGSSRSTCRNHWRAFLECRSRTGGTTRRICSSRSAASARVQTSACVACDSTRTTFRRRCLTGRARPAASASCRRTGSRCCEDRSPHCTGTLPAVSSRCSPRTVPQRRSSARS